MKDGRRQASGGAAEEDSDVVVVGERKVEKWSNNE